jgi:enterochelin esterase-like enzyme
MRYRFWVGSRGMAAVSALLCLTLLVGGVGPAYCSGQARDLPALQAHGTVDDLGVAPASVTSPPTTVTHFFASEAVGRTTPYLVYLPPDYALNPERRYPVLYMLHGVGGNDPSGQFWEWAELGLLKAADYLIRAGAIEPLIIVLPQGEDGYWVDQADNGPQWGYYVARELVTLVDAQYRTLPNRAARAIGGLSMGGHGALQIGMKYADVFRIIGAHSPTIRGHDTAPYYFGDAVHFTAHDPISLAILYPDTARSLDIWLDVGAQDEVWRPVAESFAALLEVQGIPYTWYSAPGDHHGDYWTASGPDYLRHYSAALQRGVQENLTTILD